MLLHTTLIALLFLNSPDGNAQVEVTPTIVADTLQVDDANMDRRQFQDLSSTYSDEAFIYERTVETSGWWTRFKKWLSDKLNSLFNFENRESAAKAIDIAIKVAGVILFLLVIYFIFRAIVNKEGKWVFGKSSDKNIIPVTDLESNIHAVDFKALIKTAEQEGNYRMAVRYYYLWLLKALTNAEIIEYDVEKTNSDYFNEITTPSTQEDFAYTSYLYNYIWYGEFDVDDHQFKQAKLAFTNFLKTVKA